MSVEELATLLRDGEGSDYAVIDVRRNDRGVCISHHIIIIVF
jgi:hypothetical protein